MNRLVAGSEPKAPAPSSKGGVTPGSRRFGCLTERRGQDRRRRRSAPAARSSETSGDNVAARLLWASRSVYATFLCLQVLSLPAEAQSIEEDRFSTRREQMVEQFVRARGVDSPNVLSAMRSVPRHLFVPEQFRSGAYEDRSVQVDDQFGVPEPYTIARMTELLDLRGTERILEIGTGTGYHTAVLANLSKEVHSMEIVPERAEAARETLEELGYDNVSVHVGNGYEGLPEEGLFDAIVLTAAPEEIPEELVKQLKVGGKMVIPLGGFLQELQLITKKADGTLRRRRVDVVRMRPMVDVTDERPSGPPGAQ